MENTGRIRSSLSPVARRILFEEADRDTIEGDLRLSSEVDQAHIVMLAECGIVSRAKAAQLLRAIERLRTVRFAPLINRESTRGLYLLYEHYLIETEGPDIGGILQTARSRNDLNATVHKLKLREPFNRFLGEGLRFQATLIRRARLYRRVVMPAYTHGQAAMPSSYGHYLAAIAKALERDFDMIRAVAEDLNRSPLGAGAVCGTTLPINTARTAQLLGFCSPVENSIDVVASRDLVLRLLGAAAILGVTLSRIATDLLQWSTSEFNFLELPDEIIGSSSAMPQKRNPFLLEHVQGRTSSVLGAFVSAITATHSTPFTNSIAVGTEAIRPVWRAFRDISDALTLIRLVVANAKPREDVMLRSAVAGMTTATALANRLVSETECDFRTAHRLIGEMVLHFIEDNIPYQEDQIAAFLRSRNLFVSVGGLDPASVTDALEWGGGPNASSIERSLQNSQKRCADHKRWSRQLNQSWSKAKIDLDKAVEEICSTSI